MCEGLATMTPEDRVPESSLAESSLADGFLALPEQTR